MQALQERHVKRTADDIQGSIGQDLDQAVVVPFGSDVRTGQVSKPPFAVGKPTGDIPEQTRIESGALRPARDVVRIDLGSHCVDQSPIPGTNGTVTPSSSHTDRMDAPAFSNLSATRSNAARSLCDAAAVIAAAPFDRSAATRATLLVTRLAVLLSLTSHHLFAADTRAGRSITRCIPNRRSGSSLETRAARFSASTPSCK
jgi:hypothetical protein